MILIHCFYILGGVGIIGVSTLEQQNFIVFVVKFTIAAIFDIILRLFL